MGDPNLIVCIMDNPIDMDTPGSYLMLLIDQQTRGIPGRHLPQWTWQDILQLRIPSKRPRGCEIWQKPTKMDTNHSLIMPNIYGNRPNSMKNMNMSIV